MKKYLYIIISFLLLFANYSYSQTANRLLPEMDKRDSIFSVSQSKYKSVVKNRDSLFTYMPEAWELTPDAKVGKKNIQEKSLSTLSYSYSDLSHIPTSHAIDKSKDPGDIQIVQGGTSGALTYSVPFDIYLTENGFKPEVYLGYNSQINNGVGGIGWQIGGISAISATNSTPYYDNTNAPVKLNKACAFLLDGVRLIDLKTGTTGTINYETERGDIKVTAYLNGENIKYFIVKYPDGRTATFGYTTNNVSKLSYPLTQIEDLKGNLIDYSYNESYYTYYLNEIKYGAKKETSIAHFASIKFSYEARHDVTSFFIDGLELKISQRLTEVNTYFNNQAIRKYQLTYNSSSPVSLLKQIDCVSEGKSLNPLIFYYGENNQIVQFEKSNVLLSSYFSNSSVPNLILSKGKFDFYSNSDGLVSYPRISNWDIIVTKKNWLGNPIAYQYGSKYHPDQSLLIYDDLSYGMSIPIKLTAESGFLQMLVADVDGDGVDEIVKINSSVISSSTERLTFKVYSIVHSLGQGFASLKYQFTADFGGVCSWEGLNSPPPRNYIVGDFLGNGKQSVLCLSYNKNAKNETVSSWATLIDIDGKRKSTTHDKTCFSFDFQDYAYALDFDGDGKMDICHVGSGSTKIYSFNSSGQLVEVASTYGITRSSLSTRELLLGDINGDGKTDLVLSPRKDDYTYKTTEIPCGVCNGCRNGGGIIRPEEPYPLLRNLSELDSHSHNYANHVELNKDSIKISPFALKPIEGFCSNPQIYREKIYNTSSTIWTTYYSTGKGFSSKTASICRNEGNIKFALQDMNGDNIPDLVTNGSGYIRMYLTNNGILSTSAESQYCSVNSDAHFITGSVEQYYKMSQLFSLYNHELVPITFTRNDSKQRLLTGVVNSLGAINKHLYANIQSGDSYYNGTKCAYPYMNLSGKFYVVKGLETYMNNSLVSAASLNYEKGILDLRGRGFLGFEKITTWDNLRGRSTTQVFDPYNFGVLKSEDSPLSNSTYTYSTSIASNRIAKVRMTYKSVKDKLKDVTTTYSYTHDTYGNITREIVDYGSGVSTTVNNVYYNYTGTSYRLGLLYNQSTTDVRNNKSLIRKLLISYDAKYQPINKRELYSENLVSEETLVYDSFYNVTEKKSKPYSSSTWLSLKFSYDQYGRQVRKTDALGLTEDYTYNTKGLLVSSKNHKGQLTTYEYNVWNQKIKEVRPDGSIQTITSSWSSSPANSLFLVTTTLTGKPTKQIYYDALGRGVREGELRFDGKYLYIDNVYDSRGRVQKTSLPFKGTSATHWNIFSYDTYDRVTQLAYASGKKDVYSYDKNSVTSVIDNISTTKTYDTSGELISVSDPAGTIKFTLRPDRQIESTVSPGTVTTNFEYDVYGRQTAIVDPSAGRKTFAYDSYGNISQETNANGSSLKFTYDVYGRMTKKEIVGEQTVTYNFNTDGLLTSENSTNGTSKTYAYDANFQLTTEKETIVDGKWLQKTFAYSNNNLSSTVYSSNTGSIVTENYLYANGNLTEIKLNNATSIWKLTSENDLGMTTGVATGVLSQSYTFDQYGFPIERSVKNGSAFVQNFSYNFNVQTSNLNWRKDNTRNIQENFSYDNLNRLTHFSGNVISYDVKGNITDNTGVGKFSYNSGKPFAIETITPYGNSIPLRSQLVTYNALMRPTSITENGYIANYTYNGDGDRVKMHVKKNNTDELIRHYIGNQYEAESGVAGTKERLYLGGDAYTATAVYVKEGSGSWTVNFICRDYLGSITHVTNASGQLRQELSYDPWGRLRNPTNHAIFASGSEPSLILARGFTGHEHLTMFALINMNARLYDPILGRFLSPDPYIQNPFFSQNFNRYSYAWNNPLRFTDPDGEFIHIIVGAVVGGVINWVANGCQFNAKGLGYFGAGAASGALTAAFGPLGAMAGGAILGASNAALGGGDLGDILKGAGIGAVTGLVSGYAGQWASQYLGNVAINGFSVASPILKGAIGGSLGGGVGGFAGGFTAEFLSTGNFNKALDAGWSSAKAGFAMGGVMGAGAGAKWAHDNNKNMWTGKDINSKAISTTTTASATGNNYTVYEGVDPQTGEVKYVGITKRDPNVRFNEHLNSGTNRAGLRYQVVQNNLSGINAHIMEQNLINQFGMTKNGGVLYNKINSIAPKYWQQYGIKP